MTYSNLEKVSVEVCQENYETVSFQRSSNKNDYKSLFIKEPK